MHAFLFIGFLITKSKLVVVIELTLLNYYVYADVCSTLPPLFSFTTCGKDYFNKEMSFVQNRATICNWNNMRNRAVCRSQWPRSLRRWFRPLACWDCGFESRRGAWISVSCECCVLSGRGLCDGPIPCPEESYRVLCV
jgi:hypothetical protein